MLWVKKVPYIASQAANNRKQHLLIISLAAGIALLAFLRYIEVYVIMILAAAVKSCSAARAGRCIHIFPDAQRAFAVAAIYCLFTEFFLSPSDNRMVFCLLMAFVAGIKAAAAFEFYSDYIHFGMVVGASCFVIYY